jgi:hypothetical protein
MAIHSLTRRHLLTILGALGVGGSCRAFASESIEVPPHQPYFANVNRALSALAAVGAPVAPEDAQRIFELEKTVDPTSIEAAERILDRYTVLRVAIEADGYARAAAGGAERFLMEQGWRVFLVRVFNTFGSTDQLKLIGPVVPQTGWRSTGAPRTEVPDPWNAAQNLAQAWVTAQLYESTAMPAALSGLPLEYAVIQIYSRDRGQHSQDFHFVTKDHSYAVGRAGWLTSLAARDQYRRGINLDFNCLPSRDVVLRVRDTDGRGCVASLVIKDKSDRVYPLQAMRLAPDMYFHPHIYRADWETVRLPDGQYTVESKRGPEYLCGVQTVTISGAQRKIEVQLQRWIDPAHWGWYSGDTHIHASGCAHYSRPTEGVSPETMIRHVRGEALSIGDVLTWGPSWYYQKQFFTGHAISPEAVLEHRELQVAANASLQPRPTPKDAESLLRYDVEISGFPSSHCGHLVLLRLREQDYPGAKLVEDWPSWNLPVLSWAKSQGAVVGYAHCGSGMVVDSTDLPNYEIPPMDSMGTQEAIVDVTHGVVDFLSGCNTQPVAELNAWYHMLNCGFRLALIGETDYPCISDERPGVGRTYVHLEQRPLDDSGYEAWIRNMKKGRLYCGDGRSHVLDFKVNGRYSGDTDLLLHTTSDVGVSALVAARLEPTVPADIEAIRRTFLNGWHLENARIGATRQVPVELVVNGSVVQRMKLTADGKPRTITFNVQIARSSWVALRIFPSCHTHPVFVRVDEKPIRASKRSARWCRRCIDRLWEVKSPFIREGERPDALNAFDYARRAYEQILSECDIE